LIGFTRVVRDLTERMHAEQALREHASLLDLSYDAICVWDLQGKITFWNRGAEEIYGWTKEEALGKDVHSFLNSQFSKPLSEIKSELFSRGRWEGELLQSTRNGRRLIVASRWALQRDESGNPSAVLETNNDITERKNMEEALRRQTEELSRSNADLQQFAYVASHDLQEPLRMVTSYMQIIAEQYKGKLDGDADEFIGYAVDGAMRMRQLINALLEYSRVGTRGGQLGPISLEEVLQEVYSNLEVAIRETSAEITADEMPTIVADPVQMTQLFQNLISNAIKFRGKSPPRIHISARRTKSLWVFSVTDHGIGIDREHYESIFVIFRRLHGRMEYPGTGIGLAICKKIIDRLGGRIWVESEPGKGSAFYFTVPVSVAQASMKESFSGGYKSS
jgi:PAS domain S-box-containing protein